MTLIDNLEWRYATKSFDPNKKLNNEQLQFLKSAIRLAATSYGLQPFKVMIIEDDELKEKLRPLSYNQRQITEASHLFLFCSTTSINSEYIDHYIALSAKARGQNIDELSGYSSFMKTAFSGKTEAEILVWAANQSYIAMSNLLTACAELKLDSCPIEGFEKNEYDKLLNLSDMGLKSTVAVAVGYRSTEDKAQFVKKVRLADADLFF